MNLKDKITAAMLMVSASMVVISFRGWVNGASLQTIATNSYLCFMMALVLTLVYFLRRLPR